MNSCEIDGKQMSLERVFTHWTLWRKPAIQNYRYVIRVPHDFAVTSFGNYWQDTIERESDPDLDDGTELQGIDAELHDAKYPCLSEMLIYHGDLFSRYVKHHLQTEFIGYLFKGSEEVRPFDEYDFFLKTLDVLIVEDSSITIEGSAGSWGKRNLNFMGYASA